MKKFLLTVISIVLCLSCAILPTFANAAGAQDTTVGYSAERVSTVDLTDIVNIKEAASVSTDSGELSLTGTVYADNAAFKITDAAGFVLFAALVNGSADHSFDGKTVYLANSIDMESVTEYTPVGTENAFCGTFDGLGNKLQNLTVTVSDGGATALAVFGKISGATIKNVIIEDSCSFIYANSQTKGNTAALVAEVSGSADALITNVSVEAKVISDGTVGGIIGNVNMTDSGELTVSYSSNAGEVRGTELAGGIIGNVTAGAVIVEYSDNSGDIVSDAVAGGILASSEDENKAVKLESNENRGTVVGVTAAGGILGALKLANTEITNCVNSGETLVKSTSGKAGGIYGSKADGVTENKITGCSDTYVAQSVGYSESLVTKKDLTNVPDIKTLNADGSNYIADSDTELNEYKITDAEGLKLLSTLTNGTLKKKFEYKTVYLANDIDMTGVEDFVPIGSANTFSSGYGLGSVNYAWYGTFDGQGHSIKNLHVTSDVSGTDGKAIVFVSLFGAQQGGEIKNLVIDSSCSFTYTGTSTQAQTAALVGYGVLNGSLGNSSYKDDLNSNGKMNFRIYNVKTSATVSATAGYVGGIIGTSGASTSTRYRIENCTNTGSITGATNAGGISGAVIQRGTAIVNCLNTGTVSSNGISAGIIPYIEQSKVNTHIIGSVNRGAIKGNTAAGIIGLLDSDMINVTSCLSFGELQSETLSNGICGTLITAPLKVTQSVDYGMSVEDIIRNEMSAGGNGIDGNAQLPSDTVVGYSSSRVVKKDLKNIPSVSLFLESKYEEATEFKISTAEELKYLSYLVNQNGMLFNGVTVYLANDINMDGVTDFDPIGWPGENAANNKYDLSSYCFNGTFDGQGHVIDNLVVDHTYDPPEGSTRAATGLFGILGTATVKNLVLGSGCRFSYTGSATDSRIGAIAAIVHPTADETVTIDNVMTSATVNGKRYAGAIVGFVSGSTENANVPLMVSNCTNKGSISAGQMVGGMVGFIASRAAHIYNCRNVGAITLTASGANAEWGAGGIVARPTSVQSIKIEQCVNNGTVSGAGCIGGIVGVLSNASTELKNCVNYGEVTATAGHGTYGAGPIYGYTTLYTFNNMENISDMTGKTDATLSTVENVVADYTVETPGETPKDNYDDESLNETPKDNSHNGSSDDENTSETDDDQPDEVSESADSTEEKKSGCKSTVTYGITVVLLTICVAVVFRKKKAV